MQEEHFFSWEGSGYKGSSFGKFEFEKLVDNQNEYVYHMQFDMWVWTFSRDAKNQVIGTYVAAEAPGSLGCVLWAVAAAESCAERTEVTGWKALSGAGDAAWGGWL